MIGECERCKFWKEIHAYNLSEAVKGVCRRRAPVAVPTATGNQPVTTNWPITASYEGCGDFEEKGPVWLGG